MIRILTDSTSDISQAMAKKLGVSVLPLKVTFGKNSYLEGVDITQKEFFVKLAAARSFPTTTQPSPQDFLPLFEEAKAAGDDLIVLLISQKLSGTMQSAFIAKDMVEYDKIHILDTLTTVTGLRLLVEQAVYLRGAESDVSAIVDELSSMVPRIKVMAMVDTLEYLHKGGRLSYAGKVAGSLLGIKPLIRINNGKLDIMGRERSATRAIKKLMEAVDSNAIDFTVPIYFGYTAKRELCDTIISTAWETIPMTDIRISEVGAAVGAHTGPGACVMSYLTR